MDSLSQQSDKLWMEQCAAAAYYIRPRFGLTKALAYLIGEQFINILDSPDFYLDGRADLPKFAAEIRHWFKRRELEEYLDKAKRRRGGPHRRRALLREARELLLPPEQTQL
jgi:hypothetical protein